MKKILPWFMGILLLILILSNDSGASGPIRIATYNHKPFVFLNNDGTYSGIYIDIIDHIADTEEWQVEYIHGTWVEGLQKLQNNEIDLMVAISRTSEREKLFEFNKEPILTNRGQLFKQKGIKIITIADLKDMSIAVYKNDIFSNAFKKLLSTYDVQCKFVEVDDYQTLFRLINEKKVQAGVGNNVAWMYIEDISGVEETPIIFMPTELQFAAPKGQSAKYLSTLDKHLVKLKADRSSIYYKTVDKWTIDKLDIVSAKKGFPVWALYLLLSAGGVILLFFFLNLFLKHKIQQKTKQIEQQNIRLKRVMIKRKEASAELVLHKKKLENLMDNLPGMAYRFWDDGKWTIDFVSKGSKRLLGYPDSFFYKKESDNIFKELIHLDDYQNFISTIRSAALNKMPYRMVYRIKMQNSIYKWVSDQGKCELNAERNHTLFEGFISDITQQQELELQLRKENTKLRSSIKDRYKFGKIIGKSEAMQLVYELILKASASSESVCIYGETGTGKELVARAIHDLSDRRDRKFIVVNCSAIPENLVESEFFGYVKGSFTGAYKDKKGFLELADGGTLFLDEIGDIGLSTQVKLLRAIEGREYMPVGSGKNIASDFRLVTASNKNLMELVKEGGMREDFYYRIRVLPIEIPPLRKRKEDIPLLAEFFIKKFDTSSRPVINGNIMEALLNYDWPGNVREFQNRLNRYAVLKKMNLPNLPPLCSLSGEFALNTGYFKDEKDNFRTMKNAVSAFERAYIKLLMLENNSHRGRVSEILEINRRTLSRKLKAYNLNI